MANKKLCTTFNSFLTNKDNISNDYITIEKDGELKNNEKEPTELFSKYYVNIVEISAGKKLASIKNSDNGSSDEMNLEQRLSPNDIENKESQLN